MGLFYEVAKGVMKKPRAVAKRTLGIPSGLSEGTHPMSTKRFAKQMPWEDYVAESEEVGRTVERESGFQQRATRRSRDIIDPYGKATGGIDEDVLANPKLEIDPKYMRDTSARGLGLVYEPNDWVPGKFREKAYQRPERTALRAEVSNARAEAARKKQAPEGTAEIQDYRSNLSSSGTFGRGVWEEPPTQRAQVDISDAQWQRYLERIADRTPSGQTIKGRVPAEGNMFQRQDMQVPQGDLAAREAMGAVEPQVPTEKFGRLREPIGSGKDIYFKEHDMPLGQAMDTYMKDLPEMGGPGKFIAQDQHIPRAKNLSIDPEGKATYSQRTYHPFGKDVKKLVEIGKKATPALDRAAEKSLAAGLQTKSATEIGQSLVTAEALWKMIKGRRSLDGRVWDRFREGAKGRYKPKDTHDYFVSVAVKWFNDPAATKAYYGAEVRHLEGLWNKFQEMLPTQK